jgi:putative membrane protein
MIEHESAHGSARIRTLLANERTLLAYVRTSIMLGFSGITALKIFPYDRFFLVMGIVLIPLAGFVGVFGYVHSRKVRARITR